MKIINKLSLRYLKENKKKVIVIILNIILSTMLLFAVALGSSTIRGHNVKSSIEKYGDHHLIFKQQDIDIYQNLINDTNIKEITTIQKKKIYFNNNEFNLLSFNKNIDKYIYLETGNYPKTSNEIIIINNDNYKINDYINNYKIVGTYTNIKKSLPIDNYTIITKDNLNEILPVDYLVTFNNSLLMYKDFYQKADELKITYTLDRYNDRVYDQIEFNVSLLQSLGQYPTIKEQIGMYSILFVILLVISMFCIMTIKNSFEISLLERKKYFGILRSLGANKKQIFLMVLYETFILSLISIPIGLFLGYEFTNIIITIINNMLKEINIIDYKIIVYPEYMIIASIFIIITIILSAIKPAKKSSNIYPIEVIKENKTYHIQKSKEQYPTIKKIFGTEGELAYKNLIRNSSKFTVIVNSLIVSIILFITLSSFINFLYSNIDEINNRNYDIEIYTSNIIGDYSVLDEIKNINAIEKISIVKRAYLNFKKNNDVLTDKAIKHYEKNKYSSIELIGIDKSQYNELKKQIELTEDIPILYNYNTYYENDTYNQVKWFKDNIDKIEICSIIDDSQNNVVYNKSCYYTFDKFHVLNEKLNNLVISDLALIVPIEWFDEIAENYIKLYDNQYIYEVTKSLNIGINSNNFIEVDRELNKIFNKYSYLELDNSYYNYQLNNYEENLRISTIKLVISISMTFIIIICITSIINTMNTNLSLRESEFAVLRSIGLSKKGLNKVLLLESIFLGIKTLIYGIPSSTFFVLILMYLSYLMTGDIFTFPISSYIISFIGIFIIVFIMNIYSNNKIKKNNIIDSIRKQSI